MNTSLPWTWRAEGCASLHAVLVGDHDWRQIACDHGKPQGSVLPGDKELGFRNRKWPEMSVEAAQER